MVQPHPSSDLPPFGNQNPVSRHRLPIILINPTRSVGAVVCAEGSRECEFRGTLTMNRLIYLASLWVCLATIQAFGQEVVQSSPDRSPVQGAGSPGSVIPLPPASRPRPQPETPAPPRGTTSAPVPDQARPRSPGGQPPGARPPAGSPTPSAPAPSPAPALALTPENVFAQALADSSTDLTGLAGSSRAGIPQMLGDQGALFGALRQAGPNVARVPFERGYKMADNQSPMPQDRFFVAFNFDLVQSWVTETGATDLF
jgi:hypothetical protein